MPASRVPHAGKLVVFIALGLADWFLTWQLLTRTGVHARETNPVAGAWLATHGWAGLLAYKMLVVGCVAALAVVISRYRPRAGGRIRLFACLVTGAVVVYSYWLLREVTPESYGRGMGPPRNGERTACADCLPSAPAGRPAWASRS